MNLPSDQSYLLNHQYRDASNLDARIQLHARFSTNPYAWQRWVFDQLDLPSNAHVLELGCGSARLWVENQERIPPGWEITLSDFSPGMLAQAQKNTAQAQKNTAQAQKNTAQTGHPFRFEQIDAQSIPFEDASLDAVIANHMLYHVPDLPRALGEIRRVLKPGGRLYAATNGDGHMRELDELLKAFDPRTGGMPRVFFNFSFENGAEQLAAYFSKVSVIRYDDALIVTEAAPLVAYAFSFTRIAQLDDETKARLSQYIEDWVKKNNGQVRIGKEGGLFIAQRDS